MRLKSVCLIVALAFQVAACTSFKRWCYEGGDRDSWQKPAAVVAALQLDPGDVVADIGAGGGYFTFRFADAVGPTGKVYAVDVDEGMIDYLKERAASEKRDNVEAVLAAFDDPRLPERGVDMIFTSNTYHHLSDRTEYFRRAARYLKPGGRIAIVEYNDHSWFAALFSHYTPPELIKTEMEAAGYAREIELGFLDRQSFQIFVVGPTTSGNR
jgi:ubiquinone/menaquinone biosynthesis C-methylase UbiE